ncbi:MAG: RHS repeat-associated core domain-containing protein, partial [Bacteroidales bacterium]|nr:RHS repeat-associated core domain-containing protein [Bacteroidales bacterium]
MPQYQVTERYSYDSADQLLTAESTCNNNVLCSGAYSYNNWGKINTYTQQTTDPATNISENKNYRYYFPGSSADMAQGQTSFAPIMKYDMQQSQQLLETCTYGINGSIRKRVDHLTQNTDYYYFNTSGNLKACGTDMQISVYGYNSANTRTYKVNLFNANQWVNGQPQPIQPMVQNAMFYPNTYINFTQAGEYTKHYYNGTERIASRLGEQQVPVSVENEQELEAYKQDVKQIIYNAIGQHLYDEPTDMQEGDVIPLEFLQVTGDNNAIFYYHPNHLASTMYVTDVQQSVVQSFLYAPYGDIISEYNPGFNGNVLPNYAFNTKELDEETGMFYYEARYYAPPTFTSRDPLFEKYFWMSPYAYCANNPVKYVDPTGCTIVIIGEDGRQYIWENDKLYQKCGRLVEVPEKNIGKSVKSVASSLKQINSTKEGHIVLSELSLSETKYTITGKQKDNTDACFSLSDQTLYMNKHYGVGEISHELFHAYQFENGRREASVYNEVEAYVFQKMMDPDSENSGFNSENKVYEGAMNRLKDRYNNKDFSYAVSHFRRDSQANSSKAYKDYVYVPQGLHCGNSLLKKIR